MDHATPPSGARVAAEEIFPMPLLPKLLGSRRVREVEAKRRAAERVIDAHCLDRAIGLRALHALTAETRRLALAGRAVPPQLADALTTLQRALGVE